MKSGRGAGQRGFATTRFCMADMFHARNNTILFLWDKMIILMQNIYIVPSMQDGLHAKSSNKTKTCMPPLP